MGLLNKKYYTNSILISTTYLVRILIFSVFDKTYKRKVYEIVIKLNYTVGEDRRSEFKFGVGVDNSPNQYNNPMGYRFELGLAERKGFEPSIPR